MSGLSCAYHLGKDYLLLERSSEPGGLSRSIKQDGFVFDHTGHLLHLRNPYTLRLIPELLKDNLAIHERRAWIYSNGVYTRYPFQANTYGLPKNVIKQCIEGFVAAQLENTPVPSHATPEPFGHWVMRTFGAGFAKHFFFPYNEKLWTVPPDVLTAEWVAPFVPRPSVEEIIMGALTDQTKKFGYNATFYYPKEGGIQALAFAFARDLTGLRLQTEVTGIDLKKREVTLANGGAIAYSYLVSTLPLARFLKMAKPLPMEMEQTASKLRWTSVYDINLGIDRANVSDKHWVYYPEKKYRFYRVGFPMNFSTDMTPHGKSSLYVEIAYTPGQPPDDQATMKEVLRDLRRVGLLRKSDRILTTNILHIPVAYVIFDQHRTAATNTLLSFLETQNIYSIGRFGAWKYSYMEEAILEGQAAAEKILGRNG